MRYYLILFMFLLSCGKNGYHEELDERGRKSFGNYENGKKTGKWFHFAGGDTSRIKYYERGSLLRVDFYGWTSFDTNMETRRTKIYKTEHYRDTLKHGETKLYYNGKLEEISNYKNDKLDGLSIGYDSLGNLETEIIYKDDEMISFRQYHSNGELFVKAQNISNGPSEFYDTLGTYIHKVIFENYAPIDTIK